MHRRRRLWNPLSACFYFAGFVLIVTGLVEVILAFSPAALFRGQEPFLRGALEASLLGLGCIVTGIALAILRNRWKRIRTK